MFKSPVHIRRKLKKLRIERGLTMTELGRRAGLKGKAPWTSIGKYERGHLDVTLQRLFLLAKALGVKAYIVIKEE